MLTCGCNDRQYAISLGEVETFIIPSFGFEIDPDDIRKPGLIRPEKTYRTEVSYVGYRNNIQLKPTRVGKTSALVMFSEKDEMAVLNRSDFHICEQCGFGMISQDFMYSKTFEHRRPGGQKCFNKYMKRYSLGYRFETDVFMIAFPEHPIAYTSAAEANSVLYALLRGVVDVLDLEDNDVAGCLQSIGTQIGRGYSYVLYDTTPGGAGHMRRLQVTTVLNKAIERACALMKMCSCGGPEGHASCYACLRNYRNQKLHVILDRSLAIQYFEQLL